MWEIAELEEILQLLNPESPHTPDPDQAYMARSIRVMAAATNNLNRRLLNATADALEAKENPS